MKQNLLLFPPFCIRRLSVCVTLLTATILPLAARPQDSLQPANLPHTRLPSAAPGHDPSPPAQKYWQQKVDYTIDVSLDTTEFTLDGFVRMQYANNSPDTLSYIWFHLWPNAYKNDETAYSEQLLGNDRTDFYFSDKDQRGYINRLDLRADGIIATMEDHPQYIDIVKMILPRPLPPGGHTEISTPFHEKLPFDFSGYGHSGSACQLTQWFPKPAVYDRNGWHPLPYLDQGGSYGEYGNFDVRITVPGNYTVAATGERVPDPQLTSVDAALAARNLSLTITSDTTLPNTTPPKDLLQSAAPGAGSSPGAKTLRYREENIQDFAWFADKKFIVDHDTLQLPSGRIIDLYAYYPAASASLWKHCIPFMKTALNFRSALIGEYPFKTLSAVGISTGSANATAYPSIIAIPVFSMHTVTLITPRSSRRPRYAARALSRETIDSFRHAIDHEVGQQWFSSILGANERRYPWMGDGLSAWYDRISPHNVTGSDDDYTIKKMAADPKRLSIDVLAVEKKDQPITTSAEAFTAGNYSLIARYKTALWMQQLQRALGKELFDSCMRQYFRLWQFNHPYPEDFRSVIETTSHRQLDSLFGLLGKKGPIIPFPAHKTIKLTAVYSRRNTDKIDYINIAPMLGYNEYDQLMIGAIIHNLDLPPNRFQFLFAPLYATNSRRLNGIGGLSYSWYPDGYFRRILVGVTGSRFSTFSNADSNGNKLSGGFYKIVPTIRLTMKKASPRSTKESWLEWKTYLIGEQGFDNYVLKSSDSSFYPSGVSAYAFRYLNQLSFNMADQRVLYPYQALLQFQQAASFYRINFTGNYFFNYERGGGMALRLFAAKFGYIGGNNPALDLTPYEPKLTGVRGDEDYTYSNYFLGRNEFTGLASQQIMIRDGGLKIRTDLFQDLQGRSDNWVAALNLNSSLPPGLIPPWLPLKLFLDVGTYAEAWQDDPPTNRFLYVGGLQLSLLRNTVNIYAPLFYSSDFSDQLKTVPDENTFLKKISFSIDIQNISFGKNAVDNPF